MNNHITGAVFSMFLHLGLISLLYAGANMIRPPPATTQPIPISLNIFSPSPPPVAAPDPEPVITPSPQPITPVAEKPEPKPEPKAKSPRAEPLPEPVPEPELLQPSFATPETSIPATISAPPPKVNFARIRASEDSYKASLSKAIGQGKHYPRRAKLMHQQGNATVSFSINRSGAVSNVRIKISSGSPTLDKAAILAVQKINGQLPFPENIKRQQWSLTIPINFILR